MFYLGSTSESHLVGVDGKLQAPVRRAITVTTVDFQVFEGLRSVERQRELVANGASRTMNSEHLKGRAVDLVPVVGGKLSWRVALCIQVAIAMREASLYFETPLIWGSVWDRRLSELDPKNLAREIAAYRDRYLKAHPPYQDAGGLWHHPEPFNDADHFQLVAA